MRTEAEIIERQQRISQELHDIHEKYNLPPDIKMFVIADKANQLTLLEWVLNDSEVST